MAYAQARHLDTQIPVIDIAPLRDGSAMPLALRGQLHAASTGLGFIYVTGHGIPEAMIDQAARARAYRFFRADTSAEGERLGFPDAPSRVARARRGQDAGRCQDRL